LPLSLFRTFLQRFPDLRHLELQGEGEPFIHPDFFELVAVAEAAQIKVSLITNGSCFSRSVIQKILDSQICSIRVSLETTDAEKFKAIRGGALAAVMDGLARLLAARNQRKQDWPSLGLAVTVLASTLEDLPAIYARYEQLGLDGGIAVQLLNPMPYYRAHNHLTMHAEYMNAAEHAERFHHYTNSPISQRIWHTRSPHTHFYDELFKPRPADLERGRLTTCPWLEAGIYLDRQGHLSPCCTIKPEVYSLGKLDTTTTETINQARQALADELAANQIPSPCAGCAIARTIVD